MNFSDDSPIYLQVADLLRNQISEGLWTEGERLPSVRQLAADFKINHLTVMKAMQVLIDQCLVEKQRGVGMNVSADAKTLVLAQEKQHFFEHELPALRSKLQRLGISQQELEQLLARNDHE